MHVSKRVLALRFAQYCGVSDLLLPALLFSIFIGAKDTLPNILLDVKTSTDTSSAARSRQHGGFNTHYDVYVKSKSYYPDSPP